VAGLLAWTADDPEWFAAATAELAPQAAARSARSGPTRASKVDLSLNLHHAAFVVRALAAILCLLCAVACRPAEMPAAGVSVEAREISGTGVLALPAAAGSLKLAVIGDSGRGSTAQREVAEQMIRYRAAFPFDRVLMLGDNIYEGPASPEDYRLKFEQPYRELLDADVEFRAVLGNHDDPEQRHFKPFNMNGQRYYWFEARIAALGPRVRFVAIDSTRLDPGQLSWLNDALAEPDGGWKIVFLHHPLYTSGRYTRAAAIHRAALEWMFVQHGVQVVFSGHEHLYQRIRPQQGIVYFVSGAGGSLRRGDARTGGLVERAFDRDFHFMLVEISPNALHFQAISRTGETIDAGTVTRLPSVRDTALPRQSGDAVP
jgi:predicted phosphodiesterase